MANQSRWLDLILLLHIFFQTKKLCEEFFKHLETKKLESQSAEDEDAAAEEEDEDDVDVEEIHVSIVVVFI